MWISLFCIAAAAAVGLSVTAIVMQPGHSGEQVRYF
jgi:hypothetical protein